MAIPAEKIRKTSVPAVVNAGRGRAWHLAKTVIFWSGSSSDDEGIIISAFAIPCSNKFLHLLFVAKIVLAVPPTEAGCGRGLSKR